VSALRDLHVKNYNIFKCRQRELTVLMLIYREWSNGADGRCCGYRCWYLNWALRLKMTTPIEEMVII